MYKYDFNNQFTWEEFENLSCDIVEERVYGAKAFNK